MKRMMSITIFGLLLVDSLIAEASIVENMSIAGSFESATATIRFHNADNDTRFAVGMNLYSGSDEITSHTQLAVTGSYEIGIERTPELFAYIYPQVGFATASKFSDDSYVDIAMGMGAEYYLLLKKIALGIDINIKYEFSDSSRYGISSEGYLLYRF